MPPATASRTGARPPGNARISAIPLVSLLALVSAACYGAADFVGGLTSRRASALAVIVITQAAGLLALLPLVPLFGGGTASARDLLWGAGAGLAGGTGVALLYRSLAVGTMAIVAPTSASLAVIVPVAVDVLSGTRLSMRAAAGILLALAAIVLVSRGRDERRDARRGLPPGLVLALWSGVAIGLFYLLLNRAAPAAGLWPLVSARGAAVAFYLVVSAAGGQRVWLPAPLLLMAAGGGVLDMVANAFYLVAAQRGSLSIVVTLVSLYPASTVILARVVLHERLARAQLAGILLALAAVVLIAGATAVP